MNEDVTRGFAVSGLMVFLLILGVGVIVLQVFLSRKDNKWAGLILPIISFGISLLAVLGIAALSFMSRTETLMENVVIIEQTVMPMEVTASNIVGMVYVFLLNNIPTAVLLAIYAACRGKRNRQRALEKMSVQDLE